MGNPQKRRSRIQTATVCPHHLLVARGLSGVGTFVEVYDVSIPRAPVLVAEIDTGENVEKVIDVQGDTAVVVDHLGTLSVISLP